MSRLLYYGILLPVSLLPFRVLYLVSSLLYAILFYLTPYRKKVVFNNLRKSFPEKSEGELREISKKFYRHLCDIILETIKSFTISKEQVKKRVKVKNPELLESFYQKGKSVVLVTSHYGNWEWAALHLSLHSAYKSFGLYSPLKDRFLDKKVRSTRSKFGLYMFPNKETTEYFERYKDQSSAFGFIADQSPSNPDRSFWTIFLNQTTAVLMGTEVYAKRYNYPVIYGKIEKIKRGNYLIEYELVSEDPSQEPEFAITEKHTRITEALIQKNPEYWLWTHRRWKLKLPADGKVIVNQKN